MEIYLQMLNTVLEAGFKSVIMCIISAQSCADNSCCLNRFLSLMHAHFVDFLLLSA